MNRAAGIRWLIIGSTITMAAVGAKVKGFHFDLEVTKYLWPVGLLAVLGLVVAYYQRRGEANLVRLGTRAVFCFGTMLQIALFSSACAVLMYVAGSIGRDYIDSQLVRCDELLGFCLPRVLLLAALADAQ